MRTAKTLLLTTAAGVAAAASVPVPAAAAGEPAGPGRPEGAAYGVAASGPVTLPALPAVASRGREVRKSLATEKRTKLFSAAAMDTRAGARHARSTVQDLKVPDAGFSADALSAGCQGRRGTSRLANAVVYGRRLGAAPRPNTAIPVQIPGVGTAKLTLNRQRRLPDGRLSVTALEASVPMNTFGTQNFSAAGVICGHASHKEAQPGLPGLPDVPDVPGLPGTRTSPKAPISGAGKPSGQTSPSSHGGSLDGRPGMPPARAPKPVPVDGDLPVTG
ncbi:hypothetical protein GCM10010191_00450 [Actinomadura vinacea]|uniref:Uncharacterized protein n=1 Tax=Actinomadura vinacea TaxID=115336 RepID=A0ABP5VA64_9ACTN